MSSARPWFCGQIDFAATQSITATGAFGNGSASVSAAYYYYLISGRSTPLGGSIGNGYSLLCLTREKLEEASTYACSWGAEWTGTRVRLYHNYASPVTVTIAYAAVLGFTTTTLVIPASGVTATNAPRYQWAPDMPVSMTGPIQFDPSTQIGIASSAGVIQRSPDSATATLSNGTQYEAEYQFLGVDGYYRIFPVAGYVNQDLQSFWTDVLAQGKRVLMWRNNVGTGEARAAGSASPYNCIVYYPSDELRGRMQAQPSSAGNQVYWDVRMPLWLTEDGETPPM